ncbi:beta-lactamase precursor [Streptomyces albus]|uniref:Beta-lactamase n=1 Tax=Streptomyces albus (strain ATCC 21838 / DSM 41398 / FERM P-419 / JCM 4703 / NBRC 107858) TaxID=1081613 RepID=A0A0B5ESZ1_STRA4|nr:beta-lactamase precursor [Streptomyces albus]AOU80231.1 beta-lactamase precursor [Streptomyces albus]AYN35945.1 class A beta-lactamase [Streptomyces albus]
MTSSPPALGRRAFLGAAALLPLAPLAGCSEESAPASPPSSPSPGPSSGSSDPSSGGSGEERQHKQLAALERKFGARLGLYALDTGTGATIAHRADERFAFCSAFKALAAAAVLDRNPLSHLDTLVRYTEDDLMKHAPVTARHLDTGMTIRQLCDAAVRFSDGTAGNLLLRDLGGPEELTAYARGLGDRVTRMDRTEPAITEATPGDPRDTSSPRAFGTSYRKILLGGALPTAKRAFLRDLLERSTTGARRIRAGVPRGWTVADKTGTGDYGTLNDIGVLYPPKSAPLLLALMSSKPAEDAAYQEELLAEATAYAVTALT